MASDTATAKADPSDKDASSGRRRLGRFGGSRLGGFILALNLFSLLILLGGALALNEWQRGLIEARQESLTAQAELLANVLADEDYTVGEPTPAFNVQNVPGLFRDIFIPEGQRARLFDIDGLIVLDSYAVTEAIPGNTLPDANPAGTPADEQPQTAERTTRQVEEARRQLAIEVEGALGGQNQASVRINESGDRVVSVSIPVRHV
uniref:stimulus-sensing domain-containing protein n=1 Tax=uncultured Brevundimonas sp. TaxID=213418 RepID=UPI0025F874AF